MSRIRCFWMVPHDKDRISLRRYNGNVKCSGDAGYHNGHSYIEEGPAMSVSRSFKSSKAKAFDSRWPEKCDQCDYRFIDSDNWQLFTNRIYQRVDTGELYPIREAPVGAMWNADWCSDWWKGSDGRSIVVKTPGGDWMIDSHASNCTMPDDEIHKCWVRHGEPPDITVDKDGVTCGAGGGSILCGNYHGFLRGGYLEDC